MLLDWCNTVGPLFRRAGLFAITAAALAVVVAPQVAHGLDNLPPASELKNPAVGATLTGFFTAKTPYEFWLTCLICVFGLAVIYALLIGLRRWPDARPEDIARPIIVITVITGTLMLVTVGYNNEQIAPAFGLFGTIVGYMLGRYSQPQPDVAPPAAQPEQTRT
jgi:hypothetical protein